MDKIFKPLTAPVFRVDYYELDKLIKKALGITYEMVADEELRNDMHVVYHIREDWKLMEPWDSDRIAEAMMAGRFKGNYNLSKIMLFLRDEGIIENGTYIIHVSW